MFSCYSACLLNFIDARVYWWKCCQREEGSSTKPFSRPNNDVLPLQAGEAGVMTGFFFFWGKKKPLWHVCGRERFSYNARLGAVEALPKFLASQKNVSPTSYLGKKPHDPPSQPAKAERGVRLLVRYCVDELYPVSA